MTTPKDMVKVETEAKWTTRLAQSIGYGLATAALLISLLFGASILVGSERKDRIAQAQQERAESCERQHSIIEMQKLFLLEHEDIRHLVEEAGVDLPKHDQDTLNRLAKLIKRSDCIVGEDVETD